MNSSIILASNKPVLDVFFLCMPFGFIFMLVMAATIKHWERAGPEFAGIRLPTRQDFHRLALSWIIGMILSFPLFAWELNDIDRIRCETRGLRIKSRLDSRLISSTNGLSINVKFHWSRGRYFMVEFKLNEQERWKTIALSREDAEQIKARAIQCLSSGNGSG
ncbi:hypothetical protein [Verminephrobacter eiseniae]|uniref:Uncharacterized protein n=1 Tax=Verminephrobacter eiseniae (strain EF01-2) TaxID=391735 RepID=A1WF36_VEREI|nr:hypothetical protein [Verminephrobacter eiseniae]ABM56243.1 hypothetical protein Veis_0458 [Verminephrobacter eiseniae EF01-2]